MLGRFAHFLLKRSRNAALVAFLCGILPVFFASVSVVIVALVTLRKGEREGLFVLAWGILPFLARAYVAESYMLFAAALIAYVLVWGMAAILRRYSSWSVVLEVCALLGVCVVLITHFFQESIVQWWATHINDYLQMVVNEGVINADEVLSQDRVLWLAKLATGFEVLLLLVVAGLKLLVARWWEERAFKTGSLRKEILQTRFNRWALLLFVTLLFAASVFRKLVFVDALIPLTGLYVIAGLCALHFWLQGYKYARSALIGFYIVLIIFPYVMVLALILGLVDSGLNLRVKMLKSEV